MSKKAHERLAHTERRVERRDKMLTHDMTKERATVEEVFDQTTRMVVFDMLNSGVFYELNGVVSSGKEARVYWGYRQGRQGFGGKNLLNLVSRIQKRHAQIH